MPTTTPEASDALWQQCLTAARQAEAERFAKLPPRRIRYAEECETLDVYADPYETHPWGSGPGMMMKGVLL